MLPELVSIWMQHADFNKIYGAFEAALCFEGVCDMTMCPGVAPLLPPELISSLCSEHLMLTVPHSLSLSLCKRLQAPDGACGWGDCYASL